MDLRAFRNIIFLHLLLGCLIINSSQATVSAPNWFDVPNEVKFANVTFQLTDVTRHLVQNEMKTLLANRQVLQSKLEQTALFYPVVQPVLKAQGVPDDFRLLVNYDKYQSSVERNGTPETGVYWCLDKNRAEEVDLLVNERIDERKHLLTATRGAAIYLRRNNILYKNWGTTLFSLIADKKIISQLEINRSWVNNKLNASDYVLLDSPAYSALLEFLAYKLVLEQELAGFRPSVQRIVYEYPYGAGKSLERISAELKTELSTLSTYNGWILTRTVPESGSRVLVIVPASRFVEIRALAELTKKSGNSNNEPVFPLLKKETSKSKSKGKGGVFYNINNLTGIQAEMCDNAITLAYYGDISVRRFAEYNDIKENDPLQIGQVYYLERKKSKASVPFHVVKEGETLWSVAHDYGITLENILKYNRFETAQRLQKGRVLWLQSTRPKNKQIEYVNVPDELQVIDEIVSTSVRKGYGNELLPAEIVQSNDTVALIAKPLIVAPEPVKEEKVVKKEQIQPEKQLISSTLNPEIRKDETKNLTLHESVDTKSTPSTVRKKEEDSLATPAITPPKNNVLNEKTSEQGSFLYHAVKRDETLFKISVYYQVSLQELWNLNNLRSNIVKIGTVLKIKKM